MALVTSGVVGAFYQCAFALPALQREVENSKRDTAREFATVAREFATVKRDMAREFATVAREFATAKSDTAELTLTIQRLCVALGKAECALPPSASV